LQPAQGQAAHLDNCGIDAKNVTSVPAEPNRLVGRTVQ